MRTSYHLLSYRYLQESRNTDSEWKLFVHSADDLDLDLDLDLHLHLNYRNETWNLGSTFVTRRRQRHLLYVEQPPQQGSCQDNQQGQETKTFLCSCGSSFDLPRSCLSLVHDIHHFHGRTKHGCLWHLARTTATGSTGRWNFQRISDLSPERNAVVFERPLRGRDSQR